MINSSLDFLKKLKENNNRDWFAKNKKDYEIARDSFNELVNQLIIGIREFDSSIGAIETKDCVFRIFRDVRFSANKDPYKLNMGAYISKGGRKGGFAGYYFHLEPGSSFLSGGIYMAPTEIMRKIREDIDLYSNDFLSIVTESNFLKTFESLGDEKTKRVPAGFNTQSPVSEYLKLKHITPHRSISDEEMCSKYLLKNSLDVFRTMKPLVDFLNRSISG